MQTFIRDGKVRSYGVTSRQRWTTLPDVPSLSETTEFKTLDVESWQGLLVPAKTDPAIVDRLAREMTAVLSDPDTVKRLSEAGFKPMAMTPTQFAKYLADERRDLARIITSAGIQGRLNAWLKAPSDFCKRLPLCFCPCRDFQNIGRGNV